MPTREGEEELRRHKPLVGKPWLFKVC